MEPGDWQRQITDWYSACETFSWRENEIVYRNFGTGPAMLMVHGFPTAGFDWVDIAGPMSQFFRVIVPDLIDYGRSRNKTRKVFHIHDQATMLEGLLRHAGENAVHIVAHDVGDTVCQELVARQNEGSLSVRIESLILMNGGILPAEHRARPVQKLLLSPIGPLVAVLMGKDQFLSALAAVFGAATQPDQTTREMLWDIAVGINGKRSFARRIQYMADRKIYAKRWVGALQETPVRIRMINGVDDPVSGGHACDAIERLIPAIEVVRLHGIGHFTPIEAAALCTKHILDFHQLPAGAPGAE